MHREQVGSWWAFYGYGWGNMKKDLGFREEEISVCTSLLLAVERDGET